jgi:hypothetical protein
LNIDCSIFVPKEDWKEKDFPKFLIQGKLVKNCLKNDQNFDENGSKCAENDQKFKENK